MQRGASAADLARIEADTVEAAEAAEAEVETNLEYVDSEEKILLPLMDEVQEKMHHVISACNQMEALEVEVIEEAMRAFLDLSAPTVAMAMSLLHEKQVMQLTPAIPS